MSINKFFTFFVSQKIVAKFVQPLKIFFPKYLMFLGNTILVRCVQFSNALSLIVVTDCGIFMSYKNLLSLKAYLSIVIIYSGTVYSSCFDVALHFFNVLSSISNICLFITFIVCVLALTFLFSLLLSVRMFSCFLFFVFLCC